MSIDIRAIDRPFEPVTRTYDWKDCALYALSIGAGPEELNYVWERDLRVIPTFGFSWMHESLRAIVAAVGVDPRDAMHAGQHLTWHRELRPSDTLTTRGRIEALYDKGPSRGAVVVAGLETRDHAGELVYTGRTTLYCRTAGGFGGPPGRTERRPMPERAPDLSIVETPPPTAPLLHRLLGDVHPLHVDPTFSRRAGFDGPILHGMCTYGYAARALLRAYGASSPDLLRSMEARFSRVAYPGRPLRTRIWALGDATFRFEVVDEPSGDVLLSDGEASVAPLTTEKEQ